MSEENQNTPAIADNDPLNTNVNDIDTSYPLLPSTYYMLKLDGCKREPTKNNDGERLTIPHKTTEIVQDIKGEDVMIGHQITSYIGITERPPKQDERTGKMGKGYTIEDIKKNVAKVAKAAGVNATVRQIIDNPSLLDGKIVRAQVKTSKETAEYKASNNISGYAEQ